MSFISGEAYWRYPALGDEPPARSDAKVLLLTQGGICTIGHWEPSNPFWLAWAPLPSRDHHREKTLFQQRGTLNYQ